MLPISPSLPVCAGTEAQEGERALRPVAEASPTSETPTTIISNRMSAKEITMRELAEELGFVVCQKHKHLNHLSQQMTARLTTREGKNVYQTAVFSIPNFPREVLEENLPVGLIVESSASSSTWMFESTPEDSRLAASWRWPGMEGRPR